MKLINKKGLHEGSLSNIKILRKNYFFSGWIENLGVVPLFLLAAFLLAPAFLVFLSLLVHVAFVLETMISLLYVQLQLLVKLLKSKHTFIPIKLISVKDLVKVHVILGLFTMTLGPSYGNQIEQTQKILLSLGEHKEISVKNIARYTISNNEVVVLKSNSKKGSILLKAKKQGYSEIILWLKNGEEQTLKVYVYTKVKQLKLLALADTGKKLGLSVDFYGDQIGLTGQLQKINELKILKELIKNEKELFVFNVRLTKDLVKKVISDLYQYFERYYGIEIYCNLSGIDINCFYSNGYAIDEQEEKNLEERFAVNLTKKEIVAKNYKLKVKILQMETINSEDRDFGLSGLNFPLSDLFYGDAKSIIENNLFKLQKKDINVETIATPTTLLKLNEESLLQVGSDIPYTTTSENTTNTQWNFAGMKLKIILSKKSNRFQLHIDSELTGPSEEGMISGNKQKSIFYIDANKPSLIFDVGMEIKAQKTDSLPLLSSIPFVGKIFKGRADQKVYKKIIAIAELMEVNDERAN